METEECWASLIWKVEIISFALQRWELMDKTQGTLNVCHLFVLTLNGVCQSNCSWDASYFLLSLHPGTKHVLYISKKLASELSNPMWETYHNFIFIPSFLSDHKMLTASFCGFQPEKQMQDLRNRRLYILRVSTYIRQTLKALKAFWKILSDSWAESKPWKTKQNKPKASWFYLCFSQVEW